MTEALHDDRVIEAGVKTFAQEFEALSERHYRLPPGQLLEPLPNEELAKLLYARLLGVLVKQPFTVEVSRPPSEKTRAVIALRWKDETPHGPRGTIDSLPPGTSDLWQSQFLTALGKEEQPKLADHEALRYLLDDARYESKLGEHIFKAFRRYVCQDPIQSKAVKDAVAKASKAAGTPPIGTSMNTLKVQAATLVAVAVAHALPLAIATAAAPVVGGIAFLLLQIGVDGFCGWSAELEKNRALPALEYEDRESPPKNSPGA